VGPSDFFWFSDEPWAWIEPLRPTDTSGMAPVDGRRVLSGIVHALKIGGDGPVVPATYASRRRHAAIALCAGPSAGFGRTSSLAPQVLRIRPTECSSTAPASRSNAARAVE